MPEGKQDETIFDDDVKPVRVTLQDDKDAGVIAENIFDDPEKDKTAGGDGDGHDDARRRSEQRPGRRHDDFDPDIGEGMSEKFKKRLTREVAKRHDALREADHWKERALRAENAHQAERNAGDIEYAQRCKAEADRAQSDLERALEAGDTKAQAEANRRLAEWGGEARRTAPLLEAGNRQPQQSTQVQQPQPGDRRQEPQQRRLHPETERWIEDNPWFNEDQAAHDAAVGIARVLERDGYKPNTAEYYEELDRRLIDAAIKEDDGSDRGTRQRPNGHDPDETGQRPRTAAPARRGGDPEKRPGSKKSLVLNAEQVETARALNMSNEAYGLGVLLGENKISQTEFDSRMKDLRAKGRDKA